MKKRYFTTKDKKLPKGCDSQLEVRLHEGVLKEAQHHVTKQDRIPYSIEHEYEPDFILSKGRVMYVIECKGRFRDSSEAAKYTWIRKCLSEWRVFQESLCTEIELIIIFENSQTPMPFSKKRKDGTKQSHGDWATKNGFRWYCEKKGNLLEGIV